MIYHVNGWRVIAFYLKRRGLHQADLAALLKITPAAISQRKSGRSLFSPVQLTAIADFLAFDERTRRFFYEEIFTARMGGLPSAGIAMEHVPEPPGRMPCCPLPVLLDYAPAAENLRDFVTAHQSESLPAEDFAPRCVATRVGPGGRTGLPSGTVLAIPERPGLPADRCTVLGCCDAGLFAARMNRDRSEGVMTFQPLFREAGAIEPWYFRREPGKIRFLLPVLTLKLAEN